MRIPKTDLEHWREVFRLMRDVGLAVVGILGPVATVWAIWIHLQVWALVIALALALIVTFGFYFWKRIRTVPYLKAGGEAGIEATKLLKATKDTLYYYGGVGFIGATQEWRDEYGKKLGGKTTIKRFLDVESLEDLRKMLEGVLDEEGIKDAIDDYSKWVRIHSDHLQIRATHNDFYDFEGAPIWRYGLHCIVFDEKHVVLPFASGKSTDAVFIRNCPELAKALTLCLDGLIDDFNLKRVDSKKLAAKVGLPETSSGK